MVKGCSGAVRYKTNPERNHPSKSRKIIEAKRDVYMEKMNRTDSHFKSFTTNYSRTRE